MRVGINARNLAKPHVEGVIRYTRMLVRALAEREADRRSVEYVLFGIDALPDELRGYDSLSSAGGPIPKHSGPRAHLWEQLVLPTLLARHDIDVFHTPSGLPPLRATVPQVTTIHDISPVTHPEWFSPWYAALYRVLTPIAVRRSDHIITVSSFARDEIVAEYPRALGKVTAVYNGVTKPSDDATTPIEELGPEPFLLFVGAANRRKNVATLLDAYRTYRSRVADPASLALVGPEGDHFARTEYDATDGVHLLGFVSDEQLAWLYHSAAAFVFPSLYEGFGLPIIESMSVGTPVITSDRGAMAEVAGDAACLVDPLDPDALTTEIERVLGDADYRERLRARGHERAGEFTWERTAERTATVYREVANR